MSEMFEPYERLVRIVVLGKQLEVPENNVLLRQLSFVAPDIVSGRYCWNGECRYCEVTYRRPGGADQSTLACLVKGFEGMQITKLAIEVKYNMSETLRAAPAAEAAAPKT
jgi:hypothetical protein